MPMQAQACGVGAEAPHEFVRVFAREVAIVILQQFGIETSMSSMKQDRRKLAKAYLRATAFVSTILFPLFVVLAIVARDLAKDLQS